MRGVNGVYNNNSIQTWAYAKAEVAEKQRRKTDKPIEVAEEVGRIDELPRRHRAPGEPVVEIHRGHRLGDHHSRRHRARLIVVSRVSALTTRMGTM